jgi:hypothetical protein
MGDAAAPASGVPNGALITYSGTWETTVQDSDPQDILRQVVSGLPGLKVLQQDIQVGAGGYIAAAFEIGTQFSATLVLQVNNGMGFAQPQDAASIVDHQVYMVTGQMPLSSGASVSAMPGTFNPATVAGAQTPGSALSLASWFENNAMWLLLGVGAIAVLPGLVKKL